ncbi:LysR family transcriptional regulator [Acinetobacter sp. ANC 4648]|uniref:LysR family transcriptional regulator n=1 Tax=Acinetobacter sp. ANC 4648 TaxID=1977875 RepID=UPI000A35306D|nr:LysR family transcriptional regulator [Acinetobacter sp. ANC 4648]OTG83982.1 LysR family transcriptional regulator [Acinetobacter sp. ANC 4648]
MPTLKQFNYLIRIVEEGSFTAASEKLFIAQSALSRQVKLLEEEVDFQIFDRTEKRVKLTSAGEVFYRKIKNNLQNMAEIIEFSQNIAKGADQIIKIAHSSSILMDFTKIDALKSVGSTYHVNFEINTLSSEYQVMALLKGEIDIGFIRPPVLHTLDELNAVTIYAQPLYLACHKHHPYFNQVEAVKVLDLREEKFISTPHAMRGGLSYLVSNLCLTQGFFPRKAQVQSRKISQLQLVAANLGICIVPEEFQSILPEQVQLLPLENGRVLSEVMIVWNKEKEQLIQDCAAALADYFLKHQF